ncbi:hypothetical protein ACOMHN_035451 [Nucella lapillus]
MHLNISLHVYLGVKQYGCTCPCPKSHMIPAMLTDALSLTYVGKAYCDAVYERDSNKVKAKRIDASVVSRKSTQPHSTRLLRYKQARAEALQTCSLFAFPSERTTRNGSRSG